MKVLVTGFGPFPGVPRNVSSDLAAHCAKRWNERPDIEAEHLVLATDWQSAPETVATQIAASQPDLIIHLGVSAQATGLVLETHAYNTCCDTPDVAGTRAPASERRAGHPAEVCSSLPVENIARALAAAGHKVSVSNDPGRYLCNAVYHETLSRIADPRSDVSAETRAIFVHIPVALDAQTITFEHACAGLDTILDELLRR